MKTLFDKVTSGALEPLDALDIALSLCCKIEEGREAVHLDPYRIGLDEDNNVTLLPVGDSYEGDFTAPEVLVRESSPNRDTMRFSLGCLLYYMLNGRSYHDANNLDPFALAESVPGSSLVDPGQYQGRASNIICALTAWDVNAREAGVAALITSLEDVDASVTLRYTCQDTVVCTEQKQIREDMENFRSGETVVGEDRSSYRILPGTTVRFRPGSHVAVVPVERVVSGNTAPTPPVRPQTNGTPTVWLAVEYADPQNSGQPVSLRLFPVANQKRVEYIPISTMEPVRYQICLVALDAEGRAVGQKRELFYVDVPAVRRMKQGLLNVIYHVQPRGFSVVLCDQSKRAVSDGHHYRAR